jgi:hypothetical protein
MPKEIGDRLAVVERDLVNSAVVGLSPDWTLNIAYNAALQAAAAALAASGYRAAREAHHYRVIQSLAFTIGSTQSTIVRLDVFRKKRNLGEYERAGATTEQEAREMVALAREISREVRAWLAAHHPELV